MTSACRGQKRASDLEIPLQVVVSHQMGAENQIRALCRAASAAAPSYLVSHLASPSSVQSHITRLHLSNCPERFLRALCTAFFPQAPSHQNFIPFICLTL